MSQQEILSVNNDNEIELKMVLGSALERLKNNEDFKTVIMETYLERKVLDSVSLLGVPQIRDKGIRPNVMEDLVAASNLQYFFIMIENAFAEAKDPVLSDAEEAELDGPTSVQ